MSDRLAAGDLRLSRETRTVTRHTGDGDVTGPADYVRLTLNTPNGPLQVDVDAGDWSRAIAKPGHAVPVELDVPGLVTRAG